MLLLVTTNSLQTSSFSSVMPDLNPSALSFPYRASDLAAAAATLNLGVRVAAGAPKPPAGLDCLARPLVFEAEREEVDGGENWREGRRGKGEDGGERRRRERRVMERWYIMGERSGRGRRWGGKRRGERCGRWRRRLFFNEDGF